MGLKFVRFQIFSMRRSNFWHSLAEGFHVGCVTLELGKWSRRSFVPLEKGYLECIQFSLSLLHASQSLEAEE